LYQLILFVDSVRVELRIDEKYYMTRRSEFILETAVQDDKVMQDFDLESLLMGVIIPKR
jgi:hypothetical protein